MKRRTRPLNALAWLPATLALLPPPAAFAASPACDVVINAMVRLAQTPSHQYMTNSMPGLGTRQSEVVITGTTMWLLVGGRWRSIPYDAQKRIAEMKRKAADASAAARMSCARVRDETAGGEATALYTMHDITDAGRVDSQLWISAAHGLPMRQVVDIPETKSHLESRFDYTNVQPPAAH